MPEWWTYSIGDLLMFSPRTYRRLFEHHNAALWPAQVVAVAALLVPAWLAQRGDARSARIAVVLAALGWAVVAAAFFWPRYAAIHWAGHGIAVAFAVQAVLLAALVVPHAGWRPRGGLRHAVGVALVVLGVLLWPLLGLLAGFSWRSIELAGLAPDPTALATLGLLLLLRPAGRAALAVWPAPLAWCLFSGATLAAMEDPLAAVLAGAALAAVAAAASTRQRRQSPS